MLNEQQNRYLDEFERNVVKNCPKCHGSGYECECWHKLNLEYRCLNAQIPLEHLPLTLDDIRLPQLQNVKTRIEKYIDNLDENIMNGKGLLLHGDYGTGKTSFASMILREVMKTRPDGTRYEGYFADLQECVDMITSGWRDQKERESFRQHIINVRVLVLDDLLGREITTGKNETLVSSTFTSLFKDRSSNLRPTIITTNATPTQLEAYFGARAYSVMMQRLDFIKFDIKYDYRQQILSDNKHHIIERKGSL